MLIEKPSLKNREKPSWGWHSSFMRKLKTVENHVCTSFTVVVSLITTAFRIITDYINTNKKGSFRFPQTLGIKRFAFNKNKLCSFKVPQEHYKHGLVNLWHHVYQLQRCSHKFRPLERCSWAHFCI